MFTQGSFTPAFEKFYSSVSFPLRLRKRSGFDQKLNLVPSVCLRAVPWGEIEAGILAVLSQNVACFLSLLVQYFLL